MSQNSIVQLAFSIHSNPGIYALLLGSGVSRDAQIPTGWEITEELIRKIASLNGIENLSNTYKWYKEFFKEAPEYSKLLDKLAPTPVERKNLLRQYFEPTEEEVEEKKKIPTDAHKAIAKLAKMGYFRVIITTNFDRLIEKALEAEGITPTVVSNEDSIEGALPYVHCSCLVIKANGDYMDVRIRNTVKELMDYPNNLKNLLDRIFDEFGLIVCGWSGEWDIGLQQAILRTRNRRFPSYWFAKGELTEAAENITKHRISDMIHIESANQIFLDLQGKIESLREFEKPHPLSYALATATVKRYLSEEKYYIQLFDLINREIEVVYKKISSELFTVQIPNFDGGVIKKRLLDYEATIKILLGMLLPVTYFDHSEKNAALVKHAIERLASPVQLSGSTALINLQHYPALLLMYGTGISALAGKNWLHLRSILLESRYKSPVERTERTIFEVLNIPTVFSSVPREYIPREKAKQEFTPENNYIYDILSQFLQDYIAGNEYEEYFDIFEYLLGLLFLYETSSGMAPEGCFLWRYFGIHSRGKFSNTPMCKFLEDGLKQGNNWEFLKAGFFDGQQDKLKAIIEEYNKILVERGKRLF